MCIRDSYCCGATVQSAPHLGHVRKEVNFDVLRRWLEASGYDVTMVTNVTDIDDKIQMCIRDRCDARRGPARGQARQALRQWSCEMISQQPRRGQDF